MKSKNQFETKGATTIIWTTQGRMILVDTADLPIVEDYTWCLDSNGYAVSHTNTPRGEVTYMHRLLMQPELGFVVDHRKENSRFDNRRDNLRILSQAENLMNRHKANKNNKTSGVLGVTYRKAHKRWVAIITVNRKTVAIGEFKELEDAINARLAAEERLLGDIKYREQLN